jgi:hypothetical protein
MWRTTGGTSSPQTTESTWVCPCRARTRANTRTPSNLKRRAAPRRPAPPRAQLCTAGWHEGGGREPTACTRGRRRRATAPHKGGRQRRGDVPWDLWVWIYARHRTCRRNPWHIRTHDPHSQATLAGDAQGENAQACRSCTHQCVRCRPRGAGWRLDPPPRQRCWRGESRRSPENRPPLHTHNRTGTQSHTTAHSGTQRHTAAHSSTHKSTHESTG